MDGTINGNERAAATATDQRALVLIDALGARLVEAIKAGVNATADGLGVLAGETERLDRRIGALAELLDRQAPVEATVDLTPILEILAELRAVVAHDHDRPEPATRDQLAAEGGALAARLEAVEASVRAELSGLAEHVAGIVAQVATSPSVDLSPLLAELAERGGESSLDAAVGASLERVEHELSQLRSAVTADSGADAVNAVSVALADMQSLVDDRLSALRATVATPAPQPNLAPVVEAVGARVAELRGSLQARIAEVQAAIAAGPDLTPVTAEVASAVAALTERLDRIEQAVTRGPDLAPVAEQVAASVAEVREVLAARVDAVQQAISGSVDDIRITIDSRAGEVQDALAARAQEQREAADARADEVRAVVVARSDELGQVIAAGTELAGVRHDAVAARLTSLEDDLRTRAAASDVVEAVSGIRSGVDLLAERLDAARGSSTEEARSVQEAVLHAVEALAADVAAVRERAMATAEASARTGQEVKDAVVSLGEQTSERIENLRDVFSHGTDLRPFLDAVNHIEQQVADVRAAVEHHAPGAGILELLRTLGDLRSAMAENHDHVAAEVAAARSNVEQWLARLDGSLAEVAGSQAEDMAGLIELAEQVRELQHAAADRTADAAERLTQVEARLAAADERRAEDSGRLADIHEAAAATAERTVAIAGWTEAQHFEQWVADLQGTLDTKFGEIAHSVPTIREAVDQMEVTVRRAGDATTASLDGLRAHLSTAGGFSGQVERFRELRTAVDAVAAELARSNERDLAPGLITSINEATAQAAARLEATTSSALAQYARRDTEILERSTELETNLVRSIEAIESEVRQVVAGLSANERLVRSRFSEVETALNSLRGEVAHVRTLRSTVDALIASIDVLKHRARLAEAAESAGASQPAPVAD